MRHHTTRVLILSLGSPLLLSLALSSCGGSPSDGPGTCELACSGARLASSAVEINPVAEAMAVTCASGSFELPLSWKMAIKSSVSDDSSSVSTARSVGYVSVEPFGFPDSVAVTTPKSKWCSDACGYAEISFTMPCVEGSQSVYLRSGGNVAKSPITVTITKPSS